VRVKAWPPATADAGLSALVVGKGLVMVKVCPFEVPPPGVGLKTVTVRVAPATMSAAGMTAWSSVAETYVVVRFDAFHRTTEVGTKFVPVTVRVKVELPAITETGLRPVVVGTGLLTVKVRAPDVPPPGVGLKTVTEAVPAVAMSAESIVARSWVAET
jgi:hypothetical protein